MSIKGLIIFTLLALATTPALTQNVIQYCEQDSDCTNPHEVCAYEQTCDKNGCQRSERKICRSVSLTRDSLQKTKAIDKYLSDMESSNSNVSAQLTIRAAQGKEAMVVFERKGDSESSFRMGLDGNTSDFVIQKQGTSILTIDNQSGNVVISKNLQVANELKLSAGSTFEVNGFRQWLMIHEESNDSFEKSKWSVLNGTGSPLQTTQCGGYQLLGGFGQLSKQKLQTSINLDGYNFTLAKIEAVFHFIDAWSGQTAYLKLADKGTYLWTDSHDFTQTKNSLNLCGSDVGEGKFVSLVEAIVKPTAGENNIQLEFGTTLDTDAEYASWGLSALRVYIR